MLVFCARYTSTSSGTTTCPFLLTLLLPTIHYPLSTAYYCRYLDLFWNYLSYYNVVTKL